MRDLFQPLPVCAAGLPGPGPAGGPGAGGPPAAAEHRAPGGRGQGLSGLRHRAGAPGHLRAEGRGPHPPGGAGAPHLRPAGSGRRPAPRCGGHGTGGVGHLQPGPAYRRVLHGGGLGLDRKARRGQEHSAGPAAHRGGGPEHPSVRLLGGAAGLEVQVLGLPPGGGSGLCPDPAGQGDRAGAAGRHPLRPGAHRRVVAGPLPRLRHRQQHHPRRREHPAGVPVCQPPLWQ